jgi:hypothetical protein
MIEMGNYQWVLSKCFYELRKYSAIPLSAVSLNPGGKQHSKAAQYIRVNLEKVTHQILTKAVS